MFAAASLLHWMQQPQLTSTPTHSYMLAGIGHVAVSTPTEHKNTCVGACAKQGGDTNRTVPYLLAPLTFQLFYTLEQRVGLAEYCVQHVPNPSQGAEVYAR